MTATQTETESETETETDMPSTTFAMSVSRSTGSTTATVTTAASTTGEDPYETAVPTQGEDVPNPNGAASLTLSGGLLTVVFGLMALL